MIILQKYTIGCLECWQIVKEIIEAAYLEQFGINIGRGIDKVRQRNG